MTLYGFALKNLRRNRMRTVLTLGAVAVAVFAFIFLQTVITSWKAQADGATRTRIVTRHRVTFVMTLPLKYAEDVRAVAGVEAAAAGIWFGAHVPTKDNEFFPSAAVQPAQLLDVYGKDFIVSAQEKESWIKDRQGVLVGKATAERFGWHVGDRVTLETGLFSRVDGAPWQFVISAIYTGATPAVGSAWLYTHYDYVNESIPPARRDRIGFVVSRIARSTSAAEAALAIDRAFDSRDLQTLSQDEQSFGKGFLASMSALLDGVGIIAVAIMGIMALILGNTIAMGARERTREYGTLAALGFSSAQVIALIVGEAIALALLGTLLGLAGAIPLIQFGVGPQIEQNMGNFFSSFDVPTTAVIASLGMAFLFGLLSALLPAYNVSRLPTVDALRSVG